MQDQKFFKSSRIQSNEKNFKFIVFKWHSTGNTTSRPNFKHEDLWKDEFKLDSDNFTWVIAVKQFNEWNRFKFIRSIFTLKNSYWINNGFINLYYGSSGEQPLSLNMRCESNYNFKGCQKIKRKEYCRKIFSIQSSHNI